MAAAISKTARTDITPKLRDGSQTSKVVFLVLLVTLLILMWAMGACNTLLGVFTSKTTRSCVVGWKMPAFFNVWRRIA
jgi:hypothetical protein